ncbi:MAG: hemolysin family protein [bacterium]
MLMPIVFSIVFIICIFLSGLFSSSEIALVSLSHYRLKKLILKRKSLAHIFTSWLLSPQYILTAILVGNNVVNIVITTMTTAMALIMFSNIEPRIVEISVWLILMVLILIFGEITPKIFGRRYSEVISLIVIRPLYYFALALKPIINAYMWAVRPFAPSAAIAPVKSVTKFTMEEVKRLIKESEEGGYLGKSSTEMMQKVLALNDISVGNIMTHLKDVESIDITKFHERRVELIDEINEIDHTRIPIVKGDKTHVIGYINVKDIFVKPDLGFEVDLSSFIREPLFINKNTTVANALKEFRTKGIVIAIVQDDRNRACGIVTFEDIIEEIVGEILDEYDLEINKEP